MQLPEGRPGFKLPKQVVAAAPQASPHAAYGKPRPKAMKAAVTSGRVRSVNATARKPNRITAKARKQPAR